jgi:predicted HicB family RNase H-like nuclease
MATRKTTPTRSAAGHASTDSYQHKEASALIRPEAGAQTRFRKRKPMFIHERLSTQAILNSISNHKRVQQGDWINDFFGHPERSLPEH